MTGHELARLIIHKHGVDRYPSTELSLLKLVEEIGELTQAILKEKDRVDIAKEYGDVGLCLYQLGDKLDLDLDEEMREVVAHEIRTFV